MRGPQYQAARLRRDRDLAAGRRFAAEVRRAAPERLVAERLLAFFAAGLAALFFAVFAMSSFSLSGLHFSVSAQNESSILEGCRLGPGA
jgi:hypothetical protein